MTQNSWEIFFLNRRKIKMQCVWGVSDDVSNMNVGRFREHDDSADH